MVESPTPIPHLFHLGLHWVNNHTNHSKFLSAFLLLNSCWSYVGRTGRKQQLSLARGCWGHGTIVHEIGEYLRSLALNIKYLFQRLIWLLILKFDFENSETVYNCELIGYHLMKLVLSHIFVMLTMNMFPLNFRRPNWIFISISICFSLFLRPILGFVDQMLFVKTSTDFFRCFYGVCQMPDAGYKLTMPGNCWANKY